MTQAFLYPHQHRFNSTMVRLKANDLLQNEQFHPRFNSTMVRLKVDAGGIKVGLAAFQFHYGSIKGIETLYCLPSCNFVSIPLWFD